MYKEMFLSAADTAGLHSEQKGLIDFLVRSLCECIRFLSFRFRTREFQWLLPGLKGLATQQQLQTAGLQRYQKLLAPLRPATCGRSDLGARTGNSVSDGSGASCLWTTGSTDQRRPRSGAGALGAVRRLWPVDIQLLPAGVPHADGRQPLRLSEPLFYESSRVLHSAMPATRPAVDSPHAGLHLPQKHGLQLGRRLWSALGLTLHPSLQCPKKLNSYSRRSGAPDPDA